jgi:hypothetical protein
MTGDHRRRGAAMGAPVSILLATTTLVAATSSRAAAAHPASKCEIVVKAAPWHIHASGSGDKYTVAAEGMPCSSARRWVAQFTHETGKGLGMTLKGPSGFLCESFSEAASGDDHVYAGVCRQPPHNLPSFEWAPKK